MKAEFDIDTEKLAAEITDRVVSAMKTVLKGRPENDIIFSVKSLAKYLEVSHQWVYERICRNEIPYLKVGKFPRFKKSEIDCWLEKMKMPVVNPCSKKTGKSK